MLFSAIKRDDAVKVRTILTIEKNVDLDVVDEQGFSPLMAAAAYNALECLDCLLGTGARIGENELAFLMNFKHP